MNGIISMIPNREFKLSELSLMASSASKIDNMVTNGATQSDLDALALSSGNLTTEQIAILSGLEGLEASASEIDNIVANGGLTAERILKIDSKNTSDSFLFGSVLKTGEQLTFGFVNGYYLNNKGIAVALASFSYTSYIPVVPLKKYLISATFVDSAVLCTYDKSGLFLGYLSGSTHLTNNKVFTVPNDVYFIKCSYKTVDNFVISTYEDIIYSSNYIDILNSIYTSNKNSLTAFSLIKDYDYSNILELGKYLSNKNTTSLSKPFNYFKIPVLSGESFYISGFVDSLARLHNANGVLFPSTNQSNFPLLTDVINILQDGFLEISYLNSYPFILKKLTPDISLIKNSILVDSSKKVGLLTNKIFIKNVLAIGDSLTNGANYELPFTGQGIEECYPYYLNKISGWSVTNTGVNGITSSNYYKNELNKYNAINYDSCVIWLGTNGGLTDTLEVDTNFSNYVDYLDTATGNYCKIIEKLKSQNPTIKIYLLTVFGAGGGSVVVTNSVIKKISEKYSNVYFIDINSSNRLYPNASIHTANGIHFDKIGNKLVAEYLFIDILTVINDNILDYNDNLLGARVTSVFSS